MLSTGPVSAQIVREIPIQKQELVVGDCSGSMKLTVWDDMVSKFERGKSYRIKQLSTGLFNNVKALTSTKATSSEVTEDIVNCVEPAEEADVV